MIICLKNGNCYHYSESNHIFSPLPNDIFDGQTSQYAQHHRDRIGFVLNHFEDN